MAVLAVSGFSAALLGSSVFVAILTYLTYRLLSGHLHQWYQLKDIPEIGPSLPIIGHALMLKRNAGGEEVTKETNWTLEFKRKQSAE